MLAGPRLSPVQSYSSVILDVLSVIEKFKRDDRNLRLALVASGKYEETELFDEFKTVITDDDADLDDGTDLEGNEIATKYDYSHATLDRSQEEVEREIAQMLAAASSGSQSLGDITYGEWM